MSDKPRMWGWTLIFTTSATLVCCAIPIALVAMGMGATVASLVSTAPWLITFSLYKGWMFGLSGALVATAAWAIYRPGRICPADPELAAACENADKWNKRFILASAVMWCAGFFAAYGLVYLV